MARRKHSEQAPKNTWKENAPLLLMMLAVVVIALIGFLTSSNSKTSETTPNFSPNIRTQEVGGLQLSSEAIPQQVSGSVEEFFPEGEEPSNNFYDAERDLHWHAGHGHWHRGKPQLAQLGQLPGTSQIQSILPSSGSTTNNTPTSQQSDRVWMDMEYDAANNQHWHAGHGHFHPGPPPTQ